MENIEEYAHGRSLWLNKHAALIHIGGHLTLLQRKLNNALLWFAYPDLLKQEVHEIGLFELAGLVGFNSNNTQVLKNALKTLNTIQLEFNVVDRSGSLEAAGDWGVSTIIAFANIANGLVRYSYSPLMRHALYQPSVYSRINLRMQLAFSSSYSLALYENCYRFKEVGSTGYITVDVIRLLLGVPPNKLKRFSLLNKDVLVPAVREVNDVSDITVEPYRRKRGRAVHAIRFAIDENFVNRSKLVEPDAIDSDRSHPITRYGEKISARLREHRVTPRMADRLVGEYGPEVCEKAIDELTKRNSEIGNEAGWLVEAIRKNFFGGVKGRDTGISSEHVANKKNSEAGRRLSPVELQDKGSEIFRSLEESERDRLRDKFVGTWTHRDREEYGRFGIDHPKAQALFFRFVAKDIGSVE